MTLSFWRWPLRRLAALARLVVAAGRRELALAPAAIPVEARRAVAHRSWREET